MSRPSHNISLNQPLPRKSRTSKAASHRTFTVPEVEWVETLNAKQQSVLIPQDTAEASTSRHRSSFSASPTKRIRLLSPERDPVEEQTTMGVFKTAVCY